MKISEYGKTADGRRIMSFTLEGSAGAELEVLDYGGKVRRISVPDSKGHCENVAVSLDFAKPGFGGSLIGRYANRIAGGKFKVDGIEYTLPTNIRPDDMPCTLHGGAEGFHDKIWNAEPFKTADGSDGLILRLKSPDGEGGFPGNLEVKVVYTFSKKNVWTIAWEAITDKATPVNFTHHVYFNLSGDRRAPVSEHLLTVAASGYTPLGKGQIPTGEIPAVAGTDFDFAKPMAISARMNGMYDHNFALTSQDGSLAKAAVVEDPVSGRVLETWTTEPGIQIYAGGAFTDALKDQFARPLFPFAGVALETQHYPDSVNQPNFHDTILRPGKVYRSTTEYRFGVRCKAFVI